MGFTPRPPGMGLTPALEFRDDLHRGRLCR
jgi:hypothetical protein